MVKRNYGWTKKNCVDLFSSLLDKSDSILEERAKKTKIFYGNSYKEQKKEAKRNGKPFIKIIDKQQLFLTLTMMEILGMVKVKR